MSLLKDVDLPVSPQHLVTRMSPGFYKGLCVLKLAYAVLINKGLNMLVISFGHSLFEAGKPFYRATLIWSAPEKSGAYSLTSYLSGTSIFLIINITIMKAITLLCCLLFVETRLIAQNVGIGTITPSGKLHIKGSADTTQLIIDAFGTQSNTNPLIKLRNNTGADLMWIHSDHSTNSFAGLNAGRANNAVGGGINNTFIGSGAGYSNTTGYQNTAIGYQALFSNTTGIYNTANGNQALSSNTTGGFNTANGMYALWSNITGNANTANGQQALRDNTTGHENTANGYLALASNTTGFYNTATGSSALQSNTTGTENTANGYQALFSSTTGTQNTASGVYALFNLTTGIVNTATGDRALYSDTSGSFNTADGFQALNFNTTGNQNTATGYHAMYSNTTGYENTANGESTLGDNSTGFLNTADGWHALILNTSGYDNTAIGNNALGKNNGFGNTSVGRYSLYNNTVSSGLTAIGYNAGFTFDNGNNSTFLGNQADANAAGYAQSTAIGAFTIITASSQVRIGAFTSSIGGPQNWTNTSDGRIKLNVLEDVPGLSFIKLLRPVTYNKSIKLESEITGRKGILELPADNMYEKIRYSGFIAQEVEKEAKEIGYDFSGVDAPKNAHDLYGLRYAEFVVPLVKGMQEQQQMIERQQQQIEELKKQVEQLLKEEKK